jgi:hypothetical protein
VCIFNIIIIIVFNCNYRFYSEYICGIFAENNNNKTLEPGVYWFLFLISGLTSNTPWPCRATKPPWPWLAVRPALKHTQCACIFLILVSINAHSCHVGVCNIHCVPLF